MTPTLRRLLAPLAASLALALGGTAAAQEPAGQPLMVGTSWYPEQWPESRWEADLALMEKAHIGFVRVADFAWSALEPREGVYDLAWLQRAVRAAERHHIKVVMTTPTAAPPAWLTTAYPETLRTLPDGRLAEHGNRQQADLASARYRALFKPLVARMARAFGRDPNVIGWQVDNEIGEDSQGPEIRARLQDWLKAKYGTLEALNARWTTAYWSETYQDWRQIPIPPEKGANPGLMLNWRLFLTDAWRGYQGDQIAILRAHVDPRQRITTNMLGQHQQFDQDAVAQDFDFISWDDYVGSGHVDPVVNGELHDQFRGYLNRNFWVMETQPGTVNWAATNDSLDKGEVRAMAWAAVGHGADAVAYWQWRSALNGQEQYHGALLGPDGTPVPVYDEIAQVGAEFAKASKVLAGTTVVSQVALINDYPSRWAIGWQTHSAKFDPLDAQIAWYGPLRAIARSMDVVAPTAALSRYRLVVAPGLNVLATQSAANLEAYVRGGGHLVLGVRSGMKDQDNSLAVQRQPGALAALLGARVSQFYALQTPVPFDGAWGAGSSVQWAERLETTAPDVEVLARFGKSNGWLDGQPAVVTRKVGKGRITYVGVNLEPEAMKAAAAWMAKVSGVEAVMPDVPAGVDVAIRVGAGRRVLILTNYGDKAPDVRTPSPMQDVLEGRSVNRVSLPRFGVAVLEAATTPTR